MPRFLAVSIAVFLSLAFSSVAPGGVMPDPGRLAGGQASRLSGPTGFQPVVALADRRDALSSLTGGTPVFLSSSAKLPILGVMPAAPLPEAVAVPQAAFPKPLGAYGKVEGGLLKVLQTRVAAEPFNLAASVIFLLAILHTFACGWFTRLAHKYEHLHQEKLQSREVPDEEWPDGVAEVSFRGTLFHLLGEVEVVFGLWVIALAAAAAHYYSWLDFKLYIGADCRFAEPLFVVVIMAIAASRPVLRCAERLMALAAALGKGSPAAWWLSVLTVAPVLGSFITEPAAMTLGALLLAKKFFPHRPSAKLAYATLGLLFVNISVGGTLTSFAAPPVLMVAAKWGWDTPFMLLHFGWKALLGIGLANGCYYLLFRGELSRLAAAAAKVAADAAAAPLAWDERETPIPGWIIGVHLAFLAWTVYAAHYPVLFVGGFLFFLAFVMATQHHQNVVALRSPMLVGFFLAGLVVHGGCQGWWIEPIMLSLRDHTLMLGATLLTAFNDNAAITYLAAQVAGISTTAKYAVVAGAVAGGGLTVIANAPNPAGYSLLARFFQFGISPLGLALGAIPPTLIVYGCLMWL
ncbi:MAG: putative Na+/H+ antiporter [Verrucomicrobiota bacterium]